MRKQTIIISGMIAGTPGQGGAAWAVLQYVLGLRRLGHEVCFVEPVSADALAGGKSADYLRQIAAQFDLANHAALISQENSETSGLSLSQLRHIASRTDLLINISGMLTHEALLREIPIRVYLDLDPAFIQLWQAVLGIDMRMDAHTHFVTVGQAIGGPACSVPTCGRQWLGTLQPAVLEHWPMQEGPHNEALTTIAHWRGYGSIEHQGVHYGQKAHSLRRFIDLPRHTVQKLLLALAIHADERGDLEALHKNGWELVEPATVAATPADYQRFVQASKGEFGIAKGGYVVSRCGWFSDRSACYLASGRPVIAQNTQFARFLPTGHGLFSFDELPDILAGIEELQRNYRAHSQAARRIAVEFFDSDKVLRRLLSIVGADS